jgi:EpsI family protein
MGSSDSMVASQRRVDSWLLLTVFILLLAFYYSTVLSFYNVFAEEGAGQSHAPLLLAVSLYLLYRAWHQGGKQIILHCSQGATGVLALLSLLWMALGLVFVEAGQQAVLILIAATAAIALLGWRSAVKYLMPILLLLTVLPIYSPVVPYLQTASAHASALVLDLAGLTLLRDGYLLIIPNGAFEVADACSGLKFQIVGITLALIHTQLIAVPARVVITYVVLASLLAFVSNTLRIVIVVEIGYRYGMEHDYVQDHNFIGWVLFSILFFLFLFTGERRLRKYEFSRSAGQIKPPVSGSPTNRYLGLAMVVLVLSIGPLLFSYFTSREIASTENEIRSLQSIPGWRVESSQLSAWAPIWTRGDHSFEGSFSNAEEWVDLFATEFNRQYQGKEAVNVSHRVYDIEKWSRISRSARVVEVPGAGKLRVEETLLKSSNQRQRLVWQWYRTNDAICSSPLLAKLNNLIGVMTGHPNISVFVLSKEVIQDQKHASVVLERFFKSYLKHSGGFSS